jgi:hypothetical protein
MAGELAAVVTEQVLRYSTFLFQAIQHADHIFSLQALAWVDGYTFPGINIEDRQRPKTSAVLQLIGDEVQAPCLIRRRRCEALFAVTNRLSPSLWPFLQRQTFFLVESVHQKFPTSQPGLPDLLCQSD